MSKADEFKIHGVPRIKNEVGRIKDERAGASRVVESDAHLNYHVQGELAVRPCCIRAQTPIGSVCTRAAGDKVVTVAASDATERAC